MYKLATFLFRKSRKTTFYAVFLGLLTGVCNTIGIGLINKGIEENVNASRNLIWMFVGVCILLPLTRVASQILLTKLAQKVIYELRMHLVRCILAVPLRKLEEKGANRVLSVLTQDVGVISAAMTNVPTACMSLAIVLSGFAYMAWLFWPAAIITIITVILGIGIFAAVTRRAGGFLSRAREEQDGMFQHFGAVINGNKELKLHQERRDFFLKEMVEPTSERFRRNNVAGLSWYAVAASIGQLMLFATVGLLVYTLPVYFPEISPTVLSGYAMILMYMILPLEGLTSLIPQIAMAGISLRKVEALGVDFQKESQELDVKASPQPAWQNISYKNIEHSYYREEEDEVFNMGPINLQFKPGELIFMIGGNGSGKTTLAKMLMGLYIPHSGEITLDGSPIDNSNRDLFRQQFSAIFSDFYLFKDLMGLCPPEKDELARNYLKRLLLEQKVVIDKGSISSVDLSTGQRKRLALLVSFLEDRPIYLFDEWAADQDPVFKDVFYKSILPNLKERGKTVIVISHDDRYFHMADRIIKLEYGQIVIDTTNHDDLIVAL